MMPTLGIAISATLASGSISSLVPLAVMPTPLNLAVAIVPLAMVAAGFISLVVASRKAPRNPGASAARVAMVHLREAA